jgi:membrane-associated phospholipid phosphatase
VLLPIDPHALPVVLAVGVLAVVFIKRWRGYAPALMTIAFVHLSTRYLTNVLKDATGRLRPYEAFKRGVDESFGYAGGISFPSGHVTLFASVVIPILWVFPKTRRFAIPLLVIVAFVALARIAVNAHWVSDTLASLTLVTFVTWAVSWATRPSVSRS